MISFTTEEIMKASTALVKVLADPEWGNSYAFDHASWNRSTGFEKSLFQFFEGTTPEGAEQGTRFGIGICGWNDATEAAAVITDFPWDLYPPGTKVSDVGGSVGNMSMELLKAHPHLHVTLQDLPERLRQAETEIWPMLLPGAIAQKQIEFKDLDFLVDKPLVGCDVYLFEAYYVSALSPGLNPNEVGIRHDWPQKECVQILRNIREVLKPGARVLLHDYVLQHVHRSTTPSPFESTSAINEAPDPVLPNYGTGQIRHGCCDVGLSTAESAHSQSSLILRIKAELRFVKLWKTGEMGVVELEAA